MAEAVTAPAVCERERAGHLGLTAERREKALLALRRTGSYAKAGDACGVHRSAVYAWRDRNEEFGAECRAARAQYDEDVCSLAPAVLKQHLEDVLARREERSTRQEAHPRTGEVVTLEAAEPVRPNAALIGFALRRLDPRWGAQRNDVSVNVHVTLQSLIEGAPDERFVGAGTTDEAHAVAASPPATLPAPADAACDPPSVGDPPPAPLPRTTAPAHADAACFEGGGVGGGEDPVHEDAPRCAGGTADPSLPPAGAGAEPVRPAPPADAGGAAQT